MQYGIGAFETMRLEDGRVALKEYHLRRLLKFGEKWNVDESILKEAFEACLEKKTKTRARLKVWIGLHHDKSIKTHLYELPLEAKPILNKVLCIEVSFNKEQAYKSCNYEDHFFALQQAKQKGYDNVCYKMNGKLLEFATGSVLLKSGQKGILSEGPALDSVSARKLSSHESWSYGTVSLNQLKDADFMMSNAVFGIMPVKELYDEEGGLLYKNKREVCVSDLDQFMFS